jgi:protein with PEP-CTERM/exosortase system signal
MLVAVTEYLLAYNVLISRTLFHVVKCPLNAWAWLKLSAWPDRKKGPTFMFNLIFFVAQVAPVPDAGTTLSLLGIALGSLVFLRAKLK